MLMKNLYFVSVAVLAFTLSACQIAPDKNQQISKPPPKPVEQRYSSLEDRLIAVEKQASPIGKNVLFTGRLMTLTAKEILRGGCWDYANEVFNRAGYPYKKRETVFKGKKSGPFAARNLIQAGDWLYYINHSYNNVEHSAIFVGWLNNSEGLMLSYGGEGRNAPARYLSYDLSSVYQITRGKE
jgi:hypothetical protein